MYGDGITRLLCLKVRGSHTKYVYDRFGHDTVFCHIDSASDIGYVCVEVQLSPTLFRWLFGMMGNVTLHRPRNPAWLQPFPGVAANKQTYDAMVADYREAVRQYKEAIVRALDCAK